MSEVALKGQRGFFASFQYVTLIGGQLLAVSLVVILQQFLNEDELRAYGWRIPFVVGAVAAVISLFLRRSLKETSSKEMRENKDAGSIAALFRSPQGSVHYCAGLHRWRFVDFLHLHHLHAEILGEHCRPARQDRQLHHDRRAVPLYVHATAVRHAGGQDRPA
jgi:MFS family permease